MGGESGENPNEEEDANADLTLGILLKAHNRRAQELAAAPQAVSTLVDECDEVIDLTSDRDLSVEVVRGKGVKRAAAAVVIDDESGEDHVDQVEEGYGNLKRNKYVDYRKEETPKNKSNAEQKSKRKKASSKRGSSTNKNTSQSARRKDVEPAAVLAKEGSPENRAVRKVQRGPRYFDSPEDIEAARATCFNCGDPGHFAANCTAPKPCYVCGGFSHDAKNCTQQIQCFNCGKPGHQAKACPNKGKKRSGRVCLHCGSTSHDYSSCSKIYESADLEAIQCYVCRKFGHLCCVDGLESSSRRPSCYSCGGSGHTGLTCRRSAATPLSQPTASMSASASRAPKHCYNCGEEGHLSRECLKQTDGDTRCYKCGGEGHFARECTEKPTPSSSGQCFKCGESGHIARECTGQQAKWDAEEADYPRRSKLPRRTEVDHRQRQQHNELLSTPQKRSFRMTEREQRRSNSSSGSKKQKPLVANDIRLPKWYEVESAQQR